MKKFLLIISVVVFVLLSFFSYISSRNEAPSFNVGNVGSWKGVSAGKSSLEDVYKSVGQPEKTSEVNGEVVLEYPSSSEFWKNEVVVSGETVRFIKRPILPTDDRSLKNNLSQFQETPTKLFGPDSEAGFFLFVFPTNGIAFLADPNKDVVYEIWHFQPQALSLLLKSPEFIDFSFSPESGHGFPEF